MGDRLGKPQCWLSIDSIRSCAGAFLELVSALAKATPLVLDRIVENVSSITRYSLKFCVIYGILIDNCLKCCVIYGILTDIVSENHNVNF